MELMLIMKALGDETRLRILSLLSKGVLCVCEIEQLLNINQSNASRHLNKLTIAGLIKNEKKALYVYYELNFDVINKYPFLSELIFKDLVNLEKCKADLLLLYKYKISGKTCEELNK